jgi:2-methylcitrate dehydratase PrpD
VRLTISRTDGTTERGASDYPRGNPENPVTTGELEQKFSTLVGSRFGEATAHATLNTLHSIERCPDMADLFVSLGRPTSEGRLKAAPTYEPTI